LQGGGGALGAEEALGRMGGVGDGALGGLGGGGDMGGPQARCCYCVFLKAAFAARV
jgi:hypothetical protein